MWILFLLLMCGFSGISRADVFVITNSQTNEVISAINKDEAVLEPGETKAILKGVNIEDLSLQRHPTDYVLQGNQFKINAKKIVAEDAKKVSIEATNQTFAANKASAISKLKALGLTDDELLAISIR